MADTARSEAARLKALHAHDILDTPSEIAFDEITALAAALLETPMAAISLLDRDRVWFKSRIGIEAPEMERDAAFCSHIIDHAGALVIADTSLDPRTQASPLVTGEHAVRFYAGMPLVTKDGFALGALCVLDTKPHHISLAQLGHLNRLARITLSALEQRRANRHSIAEMTALIRDKDAALARASGAVVQMRHATLHDPLTGLANRVTFETTLDRLMRAELHEPFALLFFDLDYLKLVNDTHGHGVGDQLIGQLAERLRHHAPAGDLVARLGGDEFAVIHNGPASIEQVDAFAQTMLDAIAEPYQIDGLCVRATISIGIARFPEDGMDAATMMRSADRALFSAKHAGRNCVRLFDHADEIFQQDRFALEQDLRLALSAGQLHQVYQPIHDMKTGRIVGAEALARWIHPQHGEIAPDVFISLAEETGQIHELGLWALETACAEAKNWPLPVQVSVNFSPLQFHCADLTEQIRRVLATTALPSFRLDVELTERLFLDDATVVLDIMKSLRRLGVHLTLDDFGVGHAGLSYVRKFRFDRLKIDKSFVSDLVTRPTRSIVETVLQMSFKLGVETVAEGVEQESQRDWLRDHGCAMAQGHFYSRPLSGNAFAAKLLASAAA